MLRQLRSGRPHANLDACEGPTRRQIGQTSPQGSSASVEGRLPCALHMRRFPLSKSSAFTLIALIGSVLPFVERCMSHSDLEMAHDALAVGLSGPRGRRGLFYRMDFLLASEGSGPSIRRLTACSVLYWISPLRSSSASTRLSVSCT